MHALFFLSSIIGFLCLSCGKEENKPVANTLKGGKTGDYAIALFSTWQGKGIASRMYLKYAADKAPADSSLYDERQNTMTEIGFGPHAHFVLLSQGTYYFYVLSGLHAADTVINIAEGRPKSTDVYLELK